MSSYEDLLSRAQADYPESWIPEKKGEHLAGTLSRLTFGNSAFGPAPIAVITTEDGKERSFWLFHEAAKSQMAQCDAQPGDKLVILYKGKVPVKNPTPGRAKDYHAFRIESSRDGVDRGTNRIDWGSVLGTVAPTVPEPEEVTSEDVGDDIPF